LPAEYQRRRDPELQELRDELVSAIGKEEAERLTAEGGSLALDTALGQVRGWLAGD
jgi:hypothetical protein